MCYTCNAPGHKSPDCPKRRENVVGSSSSSNALDRTSRNLGLRSGEKPKKCNWVATNSDVPTISGKVNYIDAEFVVDAGAEITIVPGNLVYESQLLPDTVCVRGATGLPVTTNLARVEMCVLEKRFMKTVAVTSASMLCDKVLYSVPMGVQSAEKLLLDVCANEDGIGEIPIDMSEVSMEGDTTVCAVTRAMSHKHECVSNLRDKAYQDSVMPVSLDVDCDDLPVKCPFGQ